MQNPTVEENENVKAYFELDKRLAQFEKEQKEKRKLRAKTLRLLKRKQRLEKQLKETNEEFYKLLYDDKVFYYHERRRFMNKWGLS